MKKTLSTLILSLFLFTVVVNAQYSRTNQENYKNTPVVHIPSEAVLFLDDMNGDNTIAGLEARGWNCFKRRWRWNYCCFLSRKYSVYSI